MTRVVLSGFQRYFCMQYTTAQSQSVPFPGCVIRISKILLYAIHNNVSKCNQLTPVVLSGFQRYFCMQYTTMQRSKNRACCCVIRISKILLYAIHNRLARVGTMMIVVLSGFQRYFCMQYTTTELTDIYVFELCYQDFKDTFVCNTQLLAA